MISRWKTFVNRVHALVRAVPRGRVVTYGQIAQLPADRARHVRWGGSHTPADRGSPGSESSTGPVAWRAATLEAAPGTGVRWPAKAFAPRTTAWTCAPTSGGQPLRRRGASGYGQKRWLSWRPL